MNISKIDKNLSVNNTVARDGKKLYSIPNQNVNLYGVFYDEKQGRFLRMQSEIAEKVSVGGKKLERLYFGRSVALFPKFQLFRNSGYLR